MEWLIWCRKIVFYSLFITHSSKKKKFWPEVFAVSKVRLCLTWRLIKHTSFHAPHIFLRMARTICLISWPTAEHQSVWICAHVSRSIPSQPQCTHLCCYVESERQTLSEHYMLTYSTVSHVPIGSSPYSSPSMCLLNYTKALSSQQWRGKVDTSRCQSSLTFVWPKMEKQQHDNRNNGGNGT